MVMPDPTTNTDVLIPKPDRKGTNAYRVRIESGDQQILSAEGTPASSSGPGSFVAGAATLRFANADETESTISVVVEAKGAELSMRGTSNSEATPALAPLEGIYTSFVWDDLPNIERLTIKVLGVHGKDQKSNLVPTREESSNEIELKTPDKQVVARVSLFAQNV